MVNIKENMKNIKEIKLNNILKNKSQGSQRISFTKKAM